MDGRTAPLGGRCWIGREGVEPTPSPLFRGTAVASMSSLLTGMAAR